MSIENIHTVDAIVDKIVDIFSSVDSGELYYKRILTACYYEQQITIETKHLEPIKTLIKELTPEQLKYVLGRATYKFLNDNTAYGFADWALKAGKLRWEFV